MAPQIAGRLCIALIKETTDKLGSGTALNCGALKNVCLVVVDIFNGWERFKEDIYECIPLLSESC
jgi:hypothetical protein